MCFLSSEAHLAGKKWMCHPRCIFTLQLVAARLHDQAATSKEIQRATEIRFSVGLQFYGPGLQHWISS